MLPEVQNQLEGLHRNLGWRRLNFVWAKLEIVIGLTVAGLGISGLVATTSDMSALVSLLGLALFVLGAYLAMAGHRSHLYQSNNLLAAWIVKAIREQREPMNEATARDHS